MNRNRLYEIIKFHRTGKYGLIGLMILFCSSLTPLAAQTLTPAPTPLSGKYVACQNTPVTIGFQANSNITYKWYTAQSGGSSIGSGNSITVTKDATAMQTWWAEPKKGSTTYSRIRVDLELGDCGVINPTGCAATGTVIYKEDYGGNNTSDPSVKTTGISQVENYTYSLTLYGYGTYTIAKTSAPFYYPEWHKDIDDHTYPNDITRGYLAGFDGSEAPGQFYKTQIDGLCSGTNLYFSLWISNILKLTKSPHTPRQIFIVEDSNENVLAHYYTDIPNDGNPTWKQYGFRFTVPNGQSSIILKIVNNGAGSDGNDFAMDDIEIRLCVQPVTLTQLNNMDTTLCVGDTYTLKGNYTDNNTFGTNLVSRWEYNAGDINNPSAWTPITGTEQTSDNGSIENEYVISSVLLSDAGYYRMAVANDENINNYNCRAMSDMIHIHVITNAISGTASTDQTICYNTQPAQLTATQATGGNLSFNYQWQQSTDGGTIWTNVTDGTGGTTLNYTPDTLTQTTLYRLVSVGSAAFCKTTISNTVTITVLPPFTGGTIGQSQPYCYGIRPLIVWGFNSATGGSGQYVYQWESSSDGNIWGTLGGSISQQYQFDDTVRQTTYYRRSVRDVVCNITAQSDTVQITVLPLPVISVGTTELCIRNTTPLYPNVGGVWSSDDSSVVEIVNNELAAGKAAGKAKLSYRDDMGGCSDNIEITVYDFPVVDETTGPAVVCQGATIQLSNAKSGGVWTANNANVSFDNPNANPVTVTGVAQGNTFVSYTVSNPDYNACQTTKTFRLKVISNILTPPTVIIGFER
jgi:hypothetical protein